jgi:hypothetical protein
VSDVARFLPTPRVAHTLLRADPALASLAVRAPSRVFAAAAIVMKIRAIRRTEWLDEVDVPVALFQRFPRGLPPRPQSLDVRASHKLIPDDATSREGPCTHCAVVGEGRTFCPACGGLGKAMLGDEALQDCFACRGTGHVPCTACNGKGRVVHTQVRYADDQPISVDLEFIPHLEQRILRAIEDAIEPSSDWPEALRFEPQPQVVATAYRGASSVREPDFHGFFFGDALPRALAALGQLSVENGIVMHEARCFAVPILWFVWAREDAGADDESSKRIAAQVAFVTRPDGSFATATAR